MRPQRAHRLAWALAIASFATLALGLGIGIALGSLTEATIGLGIGVAVAFDVAISSTAVVGLLVTLRHPSNPVGWLLAATSLVFGITLASSAYAEAPGMLPAESWMHWLPTWSGAAMIPSLTIVMLLFPDGTLLSRRWRVALWIGVGAFVVLVAGLAFTPGPLIDAPGVVNPVGIGIFDNPVFRDGGAGWALQPLAVLLAGVSLVLRYRRSRGVERQQLKLLAFSAVIVVVGYTLQSATYDTAFQDVGIVVLVLSVATFPLSVGAAILRYRLYDIDVVINKTVVYGALAAFITGVYVALVVGLGSLVGGGDEPNVALQVLATAVVAFAFQPVRERVQRFANRLLFGDRATPYEVMSDFSGRVAGTLDVRDALPEMARAAAEGIGARHARVRLFLPYGEREVRWPVDGRVDDWFDVTIPVRHGEEEIGEIAVAKAPGDPLTPEERALLSDLASQAGLAMHNVRLAEELTARAEELAGQAQQLRRSRERLVTARDVQRRRLERDIRDGTQQQLERIGGRLGEAADLLERDGERAGAMLEQIEADTGSALERLRDLARGIFPPLLADEGIVAALESHLRKLEIPGTLSSSLNGARFDADVEAAVYFCCVQALQNAVRHAPGSRVEINIERSESDLVFVVRDDGRGFDPDRVPRGMGFDIMHDRMEALGGTLEVASAPGTGTTVTGRIRVRVPEGVSS